MRRAGFPPAVARTGGAAKQAEGKIRNAVGGITGDSSEQLKGKAKDLEGKVQRKIGEAEQDFDNN